MLLQKKAAVEAELAAINVEAEQAKVDADDAKSALLSVKSEIGKLKAERDRMLAKMESAQARLQIQSRRGLESSSVQRSTRVRATQEPIAKRTSEELATTISMCPGKLRQSSGTVTARAQLDELKRQRAASAQAANRQM